MELTIVKIFLANLCLFTFFYGTFTFSESVQRINFSCETQSVLSVDKDGELTQFLPGKIAFNIKNETLVFGKEGYITDETIRITFVNENKFYAFEPGQTLLFEDGLFHHVVSTFEGLTAIQAKCLIQND